jgi:hypothetical protein
MAKYAQGIYTPKNPEKYVGKGTIKYRSGWEFTVMKFFDENKNVTQWSSESVRIPYRHPFTNKQTIYVPDFLIVYVDKSGLQKAELIEVKPLKQTTLQEAGRSKSAQVAAIINKYKWEAAAAWCKQQNIRFRVINEGDIFHSGSKRK